MPRPPASPRRPATRYGRSTSDAQVTFYEPSGRAGTARISLSGKEIELHMAEFVRLDGDGRIVEHHRLFDAAAFMAQLA